MLMPCVLTGIFAGIMVATLMIAVFKSLTIRIMETMRLFKKGSLVCSVEDYIAGSGYHRRGFVYVHTGDDGVKRYVSGPVFAYLLVLLIPLSVMLSLAVYALMK